MRSELGLEAPGVLPEARKKPSQATQAGILASSVVMKNAKNLGLIAGERERKTGWDWMPSQLPQQMPKPHENTQNELTGQDTGTLALFDHTMKLQS